MSYIHINEVDNTMQRILASTTEHITYVPINSTDGPSGVYYVLDSYTQLCNIFGGDANPNSALMTSWEYAANLLLNNMPVMVRRITSFVSDDGKDDVEKGLLPGVSVAKGLIKVKDLTGILKPATVEAIQQTLVWDQADLSKSILNKNEWNVISASTYGNVISATVNNKTNGENTFTSTSGVNEDGDIIRPTSGHISIQNTCSEPIKVYGLSIYSTDASGKPISCIYDTKLENYTSKPENAKLPSDTNILIKDDEDNLISLSELEVLWEDAPVELSDDSEAKNRAYFLIDPYWSFTYAKNLSNVIVKFETIPTDADESSVSIKMLSSTTDTYELHLTTDSTDAESTLNSSYLSYTPIPNASEETPDNAQEYDSEGNVNLLKVSYRFAGTMGHNISVALRCVSGDGIYYRVYRGDKQIESIQLVPFRYKTPQGLYATLDVQKDIKTIWKLFLANFGITFPSSGVIVNQNLIEPEAVVTEYTTIELNPNLDYNCSDYMHAVYSQKGNNKFKLYGGSTPSDEHVAHEVSKTYKPLSDKYLYDVSYISDGAYVDELTNPSELTVIPASKRRYIEDAMISVAESRGDCEAFPDVPFEIECDSATDYFSHLSTSYGTAFAPWVKIALSTGGVKWCPPSFVALLNIARNIKSGIDSYMPPAGIERGNIPEATDLAFQIPTDYIDEWQENHAQFINPIIYINGYGINIFGQRTLYNQYNNNSQYESALQYLNVRLVANVIKRKIFKSCIELSFEYNNLHTWLEFKTKMEELLGPLKAHHHITSYEILMGESTMSTSDIRSNRIKGIVRVAVASLAEKFDITFELQPNQVTFEDVELSNPSDAYGSQGYVELS